MAREIALTCTNATLHPMMESFNGRKICVIGAARSGMAAVEVLAERDAKVTLCDNRQAAELVSQIETASRLGIDFITDCNSVPPGTQLVVTSPGVRKSAAILQDALARRIEIWSEIEAAYQISAAPIIAVTGTNGKTTTVALLGEIGARAGYKTFVAGNIAAGNIALPLIRAAHQSTEDDLIIAEISSFQLEWIKDFRPQIAIITNITVDHSDRQTWEEYVAAKWRIFENQTDGNTSILRSDVPRPVIQSKGWEPARHPERSRGNTPTIIYYDKVKRPAWIDHLLIPGEHNRENAMAAYIAGSAFGIDPDTIEIACLEFKGVIHRLEYVLTDKNSVTWINNSMCTNNDAFARSLDAISGPKVVLVGGVYKGGDTAQFGKAVADKSVEHVICFGKSGLFLAGIAQDHGQVYASVVETLQDAVSLAKAMAEPGQTVLLSPACASFDQFKDFEDRGEQFKSMVRETIS